MHVSDRSRFLLGLAAGTVWLVVALAATFVVAGSDLSEQERSAIAAAVVPRWSTIVVIGGALLLPLAVALYMLFERYVVAAKHLREHVRIILRANPSHRARPKGARPIRDLAREVNDLAAAREALDWDVESRVREANARLEQERNRLAALVSELKQSVLMCDAQGRILLYNGRALELLAKPIAPSCARSQPLVGLGRSIFAIFDRGHIDHALDAIRERSRRGEPDAVATFVTSAPAGQLIRVQMAPVLAMRAVEAEREISGFMLVLDNITRRVEAATRRDMLMTTLTQETRASLASMRAAVESILAVPGMRASARERFIGIIGEEARRLSEQVDGMVGELGDFIRRDWRLEDMRGADLLAVTQRRIEGKLAIAAPGNAIDDAIWIKADSYTLVRALSYLATRLHEELGVGEVRFGLAGAGQLAHLDVAWRGATLSLETMMAWQADSLEKGGETSPLTLQEIVERHDAEMWCQIDAVNGRQFFRIAMPVIRPDETQARPPSSASTAPVFCEFDPTIDHENEDAPAEWPLAGVTCTVFDTETTGLDPSHGDEIVAIGAVRIVDGRVLAHERFDQLVDPRRAMSEASMRVTGIEDSALVGQPTLDKVLPVFRQFCADSVLVAHDAAFDMRFLAVKERITGVRFDQPVLDTMLLSAVVHPGFETHSLEDLAERVGVSTVGRHTALGDATITANVFLRLVPLLAERGIRTVAQAQAASQQTALARVSY